MNQYLEINCQELSVSKQNKQIVLLIKGKIKLSLKGKEKEKIVLLNRESLVEKQTIYAQLFKSDVVYPPPPPPPVPTEAKQPQEERSNAEQSPKLTKEPQREHKLENQPQKQESLPVRSSIFGRKTQQRNQAPNDRRNQEKDRKSNIFQNSGENNWRNSIFIEQSSRAGQNTNSRTNFQSGSSNPNNFNQGGSSMFTANQQGGPSLFNSGQPNSNASEYSNNARRNKNKHQRIA